MKNANDEETWTVTGCRSLRRQTPNADTALRVPCPECGTKTPVAELLEKLAPPHDAEAERSVLGAMLMYDEAMDSVLEQLTEQDFRHPGHDTILVALRDIYVDGVKADAPLLREHLQQKGILDKFGGADYIDSLSSAASPIDELQHLIGAIRGRSIAGELVAACTAILRDVNTCADAFDSLARAEQRIQDIAGHYSAGWPHDLMTVMDELFPVLERRRPPPASVTGLPTGFQEIEEILGGLQEANLIILAGRRGVGKTTLALNILDHIACEEHVPALVFSPGVSEKQLGTRMLSAHCDVDYPRLLNGDIRKSDLEKIVEKGMGTLREAPIVISDTPMIRGIELRAQARRMKAMKDIRFIVVAHAHLVSESTSEGSRRQVGEAVHSLKALARELAIPILVLLQTAPTPGSVNAEPRLEDIPAAGVAEQDVDVAMILYRRRDEDNRYVDDAVLTIVKHHNGPLGRVDLVFNQKYMRFSQVKPGKE